MAVTRYNAKDCTVTIDNVYITGLGEDMVSGEKDEDYFTPVVGAQGDIIKSEINNSLGQVTVTVQITSPQKAFLLGLASRQEPFPLWVTNKALGERFGGTMANLLTAPEMARGAEAEDMEFVFQVFDYTVEAA
jgi:hypothetical protein